MDEEITAMHEISTWSMVPLPQGKQSKGYRWVYKSKFSTNGTLTRHKACLVAKGYNQQEGIDYIDIFSHVAKSVLVKILLALVASHL